MDTMNEEINKRKKNACIGKVLGAKLTLLIIIIFIILSELTSDSS